MNVWIKELKVTGTGTEEKLRSASTRHVGWTELVGPPCFPTFLC